MISQYVPGYLPRGQRACIGASDDAITPACQRRACSRYLRCVQVILAEKLSEARMAQNITMVIITEFSPAPMTNRRSG